MFFFFRFNFTPLHRAAIRGYSEVIQQLIKGGADPNATDYEGISKIIINYTPLHFAVKNGHYDAVEIIYRARGDPLKTNDLIV